ncbi:MAG: zinc ribbon domain-containing protein [Actinomycetota bacterium]|nr:zinc ribbon domain-containing protein [Actinomycetota bacterium]
MIKCEFCGEEIDSGALACPRCGSPAPKVTDSQKHGKSTSDEVGKEPEPPLAREEVDFIALAEEKVEKESVPKPSTEAVPDVSTIASQEIPPGAKTPVESVELDTSLTSGYKGPEAPSVGGAGEQTAEDPFGLHITEKAPPVLPEGSLILRTRRRLTPWAIAKTVISLILVSAVIVLGSYFGFLRKGTSSDTAEGVVHEFFEHAVKGEWSYLDNLTLQNAPLKYQIQEILSPYSKMGILELKDFSSKVSKQSSKKASIEIEKFSVELLTTSGSNELIDVLSITKPYPLPTSIDLVYQNGKWLIAS